MKAMILAAGRGERMRPLTDTTPKPLIPIGKYTLIEYHLFALAKAGFRDVVINVSYHPQQFLQTLGNGNRYGVNIQYSFEPENGSLETGGGIYQALPLLGDQPFLIVNADIWTDFPFQHLREQPKENFLAHLIVVKNPAHNAKGDFNLQNGILIDNDAKPYTMAGITVYHPKFFADWKPGKFSVVPLLRNAIALQQISGKLYTGTWMDIGSIQRLEELRKSIRKEKIK